MAMSELFKIIGIGIITVICYVVVKPLKPEVAIFISIIGSCVILLFCVTPLGNIIDSIHSIIEKSDINSNILTVVLKIIGVGYLIDFSSSICIEAGVPSIADKISIAGKICILVLSMPIITNLLNLIVEILP